MGPKKSDLVGNVP